MKSQNSPFRRLTKSLHLALTAILLGNACSLAATNEVPSGPLPAQELKVRQNWQIEMIDVTPPKKGCFEATYPNREWREVTCVPGPDYPMPPKGGPRPLIVGAGDDIAAQAPTGHISSAIGSFDTLTNVTSESGTIANSGPAVANAYTLQMNTDFFAGTAACNTAAVPANCTAWEQFVYENGGTFGRAYIQYWLVQYSKPCPAGQGWTSTPVANIPGTSCFKNNSGGTVPVPPQPITNLGNLSLTGSVGAAGDRVTLFDGTVLHSKDGDNAVDAAAGWTTAEFNVLGDGGDSTGASQANFNPGAEIIVRTRINYGGRMAPGCLATGFTAETNSLSFGPTMPAASQPGPAVIFRTSSAGGASSNCAAAVTVGDTHLQTFGGLFYDFQASGDFLLVQSAPDFIVQTRQVSGAPTWPNASTNSAVATQMRSNKIAICLNPTRVNVDGTNRDIEDGAVFSTPGGVDIWHNGNVYTVTSATGDSVRATIDPSYIDVHVGLGHWPAKLSGLLANVEGNVNQIAARDGTVLTNPFAFDELYNKFGESWRVPAKDSLLSVCGESKVGIPKRPFFARDLERATYDRTRAVCVAAGVKGETLLDACTLDVAVIGDDGAAKVFVDLNQPNATGTVTSTDDHGGKGSGFWRWILLLILILIILWWLFFRKK
jgi:hypothetical protein